MSMSLCRCSGLGFRVQGLGFRVPLPVLLCSSSCATTRPRPDDAPPDTTRPITWCAGSSMLEYAHAPGAYTRSLLIST